MRYLNPKNTHRLLFSAQSRWFSFDIFLTPNWSLDRINATLYLKGHYQQKEFAPNKRNCFKPLSLKQFLICQFC